MCKISDYPVLYMKIAGVLRMEGIRVQLPGYEILRKAILIYNVEGKMPKQEFLEKIKEGMVIPSNKNIAKKLEKKQRDPAMQWMIEAIKSSSILVEDNHKKEEPEIVLMQFIEKISNKL